MEKHIEEREKLEDVKDQRYLEVVFKKYNPGSLVRQYRRRATAIKQISYGPNIISLLTALYAVYYVSNQYDGIRYYLLMTMGVVILGGIELGKRLCAIWGAEGAYNPNERWKMWLLPALAVFVAISMAVSFYGGDNFIKAENSGPAIAYDAQRDSINRQIAKAEADIKIMEQQKWKGTITRDARRTISKLQDRVNDLTGQRMKLENRDLATSDNIAQEWASKIDNLGMAFGGVAIGMDALLIILLFWAERIEWNAYQFTAVKADGRVHKNGTDSRSDGTNKRSKRSIYKRSERIPVPEQNTPEQIRAAANPIGFNRTEQQTDASDKTNNRTVSNVTNKRSCMNCGTDISDKRSDAKYCSTQCRKEYWENKN